MRKHGLALDNLLAAQVVLADGRIVNASKSENEDLFWAIRGGGGGNFGVVTSFLFQVHPVGMVLAGVVVHPAKAAGAVLRRWRDFEKPSPNELTQGALLFHFPDDPSGPPELRAAPCWRRVCGLRGRRRKCPCAIARIWTSRCGSVPADTLQPSPANG